MRTLAISVVALFTLGAPKCNIDQACPPGQKVVIRPDGTLACRTPEPSPTPPVVTTTTLAPPVTTTTTTTTLAPPPPTTTTTLPPARTCQIPAMPECGEGPGPIVGKFGCCWTDKFKPLPPSVFDTDVDRAQIEIEKERPDLFDRDGRVDEDAYVNELVRRLASRGLCVTRGGPSDEIGLKATNGESFQYDVHLSGGKPRRDGYTAYCRPARW